MAHLLKSGLTAFTKSCSWCFSVPVWRCVCDQCTVLQHTWLLLTPTQHTWLSLLPAARSWNLGLPGSTHHVCWTNKITGAHNLRGEMTERKIKATLEHKAAPPQLFAACFKVWRKQVSFENTDHSVLSLSSTIFLNYTIMIKTFSPHNQTSVTKKRFFFPHRLRSRLGSDWRDLRERYVLAHRSHP